MNVQILNIATDAIVLGLFMAVAKIHLNALDKLAERLYELGENWHKLCLEVQAIKTRLDQLEGHLNKKK